MVVPQKLKLLAVALAMICVAGALAQSPMIPPAFYAVKGSPFTAMVEVSWEGTGTTPPGKSMNRVVRDRKGRQRFETPAIEEAAAQGTASRILIIDPVRERIIHLDTLSRTAVIEPIEHIGRTVTIDPTTPLPANPHPALRGKYLGVRQIAGVDVWGELVKQTFNKHGGLPSTLVREMWAAPRLGVMLMMVQIDPRLGKYTQEAIQVDTSDPDAALFEVPPGYTVRTR